MLIGVAFLIAAPSLVRATTLQTGLYPRARAVIADVPRVPVRELGRAPSSTRVNLAVSLKYRNEQQLEVLIHKLSDPQSPMYGHFLSPQQFRDSFAPTVADHLRVVQSFQRAGFTVTQTFGNRTVIDITAPAAVVERYFNTEIHRVIQAGVGVRYANSRPAYLPAELREVVFGIGGFDNLRIAKPMNVRAQTPRTHVALGPPLQGPDTGLSPYAFASTYDFPVQHPVSGGRPGQTYDGRGHSIGTAIDSDFFDSDLVSFLRFFHIARPAPAVIRVPVNGGAGIGFDQLETTLDVETLAGLAPGAGLYVYLIPQLSYVDILDLYNRVASDNKVDVLNSSFGGCETTTLPATFPQNSDHIAQQGAAEGITFAASSGDFGANQCFPLGGVSTPASGPHFTAVGGTSLIIDATAAYKIELAWNGSGGGVSRLFSLPTYQLGVRNIIGKTRNVPDVSFDGNPGSGESLFIDGAFSGPIGGTSMSSVIFSALVAEINQVHAKRSGLINAAIYARFKRTGYGTQFRDITLGNNAFFGPGYNALPGYDQVTGIGSMLGWPYATAK
ncbi:MAG: S53 family peptidase [Candidatus Eremiobacteraeota bacterium]|nr:S53 family peptidase [Candidatus Eremiobacteraeota bacterium]